MTVIKSESDLAHVFDAAVDPELRSILSAIVDRLAAFSEYSLEELVTIVIVKAGERLVESSPVQVTGGRFSPEPELIVSHTSWFEIVAVESDDGFGSVLLIEQGEGVDPDLIAACQGELA